MIDPTENIQSLHVLCALADLTPSQREAFIDRHVLHRSDGEIAETMGVSSGRVSQLAIRARARLAEALSPLLVAA